MAWRECRIALAAAVLAISFVGAGAQERYGIGRLATPAEIAGWNIDIGRDGSNLPAGKGRDVISPRIVIFKLCEIKYRARVNRAPTSISMPLSYGRKESQETR